MSKASFQSSFTVVERKKRSDEIRTRRNIPVYIEKAPLSNIVELSKHQYAVDADITCGQLMFLIRRTLKLVPEIGLYLTVNGKMLSQGELLMNVYSSNKDDDGFVYVTYSGESVFGGV